MGHEHKNRKVKNMEKTKVTVLGIGGGALRAINHLYENKPDNVKFIYINTDKQILEKAKTKQLLIGKDYTNGLGCAGDPDRGKRAAELSKEEIKNTINDADLLFLIACLGGGTGTGGSVKIAEMAKELNIKTYALLTYPFSFEGKKRNSQAINGYTELVPLVEETFVIHNNELLKTIDRRSLMSEAFQVVDKKIANEFLRIYRDEMRKCD